MKGKIPAQVTVGESKGDSGALQEDLDLIRGIVSEAKTLFPPPK